MSIIIGMDKEGVTDISLKAISEIESRGWTLSEIRIYDEKSHGIICDFYFNNRSKVYRASGFAIGYGGEGPHGLWKAIRYFYPNNLSSDFWNTPIPHLDPKQNWRWSWSEGFKPIR